MRLGMRGAAVIAVGTVGGVAALVAGPMTPPDGPATTTAASSATSPASEPTSTAAESVSPIPGASRLLRDLDELAVKGRAPMTGYARDRFGQRWSDDVAVADGHNGCDTRNDVLRRDLTASVTDPRTRGCVVTAGTLHDPYTGDTIRFVRGTSLIQIDHVVALADAWQKGAQQLPADRRRDFANDPRNLRAVSGQANQRKGSGDAATWLPPSHGFRCAYVATQLDVKRAYRLWVTPAEKDAMRRILSRCPDGVGAPSATPEVTGPQASSPPPPRTPEPAAPPGGYANCAQARAEGRTPLLRGEPGYRRGLDGDGDGIACE